jgi:pimeloyl-ACP methyl ester carboxylesterase
MQTPRIKSFLRKSNNQTYKISYTEWGREGNPRVLLCLHGLTRNGRDFDYLARELCLKYLVICPDVVGRGRSDWLKDKSLYNYSTYNLDIIELLKYLKVEEVDLIGTSMGGLIGMTLAALKPGLIRNLVLNDIGPYIPMEPLQKIGKYIGLKKIFSSISEAEWHLRKILAPFGIKKDEDWEYITRHSIQKQENGKYILAYDTDISIVFNENVYDVNLWDLWNKVNCPTLVLRGKKSDILLPETAKQMVNSRKNVKLVEFADIGHVPSLMEVSQIKEIKDWLL